MTEREKAIKEFALFIKEFHPACTSEGVELDLFREVLALLNEQKELLKEQEVKQHISDAIHETAKQFRRQIVMCKDCRFKECEGRNGLIVCDITGESHQPEWFCADGKRRDG